MECYAGNGWRTDIAVHFLRAVIIGALGFLVSAAVMIRHDVAQTRRDVERQSGPVCYSQTEDSELTGCDYSGGVWRPKH